MELRTKRRLQLVFIFLLFAAPLLIAVVLHIENWRPGHTRNIGRLVEPPQDVGSVELILRDGSPLAWKDPARSWTLLAFSGPDCAEHCRAKLDQLRRARITLNQNSDRLRIVYLGVDLQPAVWQTLQPLIPSADPSHRFSALHPVQADTITAALVDPNGFLMLQYDSDFDANGLRKDLARMIR